MKVAALSLAGIRMDTPEKYRESLSELLESLQVRLAVLPAHTALLLCLETGQLGKPADFLEACRAFRSKAVSWNRIYLDLHSDLARDHGIFLVSGTTLETEKDRCYQAAYCFDPQGKICFSQRQTHLDRQERALGLSRGTVLEPVSLDRIKMGMIICNDARHPETGRILALQGADLLVHTGALDASPNTRQRQLAGMWAQVQQNECWAVEAQLYGEIADRRFDGRCAVVGPCVAAEDSSGYIALAPAGEPAAAAQLNREDRMRARETFPVLQQMNPAAYTELFEL